MTRLAPLATLVPALTALSAGAAIAADTGDAPASYGLATHAVVDGAAHIGRRPPDDNEPVAGDAADGDDVGGRDDENGVFSFRTLVQNAKGYAFNAYASNPGTVPATLVAWIDFDGNGRFDADEAAAVATVPPGTDNARFKLLWRDLSGVSGPYFGTSYVRLRIGTDALDAEDASGKASDGEVEDYRLEILEDSDGDEVPNADDTDNDNDGIPDEIEVLGTDTDGDGIEDARDSDSDGDGKPDFVEAGPNPASPADTDGDGTPDYLDTDSDGDGTPDGDRSTDDADGDGIAGELEGLGDDDGDGVPNTDDLDSDNDLIPDAVEVGADPAAPLDTDRDGVPDFRDVDSDNDGVFDLLESNADGLVDAASFDTDGDGRADGDRAGGLNGLDDAAESAPDSGIPRFVVLDTDGDGTRDYLDTDSDGDGVGDVVEAGGTDDDANGLVDALRDVDGDGLPDAIDVDLTGGADADGDGIDDGVDADFVELDDADGDGIADTADVDVDGDGFVDGTLNAIVSGRPLPDVDGDGVPDLRDADAIGGDGSGMPIEGTDGTGGADGENGDTGAGGVDGDADAGGDAGGDEGGDGAGTSTSGGVPLDDAPGAGSGVETGVSGHGGCTAVPTGARDPVLPGLALATFLLALRRRATRVRG